MGPKYKKYRLLIKVMPNAKTIVHQFSKRDAGTLRGPHTVLHCWKTQPNNTKCIYYCLLVVIRMFDRHFN